MMIERVFARLRLPPEARLIVGLFLAFRLMMLMTFVPEDLTFFGDYPYYYELARLSDRGLWPYLHYWMEYPPVFPLLSTVVYRLTAPGGYNAFVLSLGVLMTLFGVGNLMLLMRLASRLHGETISVRLGWVYALLFMPLIYLWWHFEAMTAFFLLLALDWLLDRHDVSSAVATGVGVVVKLVPLLILPVVALSRSIRQTIAYVAVLVVSMLAVVAPLYVASPDTTRASLAAPLAWTSWETVWALIDGNYHTGLVGSIDFHFDNGLATTPLGNPARVPDWLKGIGFAVLYLAILWRVKPVSGDTLGAAYKTVGILTITYLVFLLWSKGWSPQWQVNLIPLILLMAPDTQGIAFVLVLGLVNLAEYPVLIGRGLWWPVPMMILLRTLLLIVLLIELTKRCRPIEAGREAARHSVHA
ncbi:MAG TPA: glycosyltransferase 87 family protein [Anaerolineae bacterium]|nr:glycosyltransferase 87 family protein [Anaerolineae bacterium]